MSMSVRCGGCGLEYAGGRGLSGLLPSFRAVRNPRYLWMLTEVVRFHRRARRVLDRDDDGQTLSEFLAAGRFSKYFTAHFMTPLVSAVWSCAPTEAGDYPARYLFVFLANHGMLSVTGAPTWYTVTGGSARYIERAVKGLTSIQTSTPVRTVTRTADGVEVEDDSGEVRQFDGVVIATHPDQALRLLAAPTSDEAAILGAIGYTRNPTALHTDTSVLPRADRAQASWNYYLPGCAAAATNVHLSYNMNRLQRLETSQPYVVTLNAEGRPRHDHRRDDVRTSRLHNGFRRGPSPPGRPERRCDRLCRRLSRVGLPRGRMPVGGRCRREPGRHMVSRIYTTEVVHHRETPVRHSVRQRSYSWFVDLDDLPHIPLLARFDAADHVGNPNRSLRENIDDYLAENGIDLRGGRITMLTNARCLGYVFNPLTLFWCHDERGDVVCVVAEVHNTYRGRHRYLLRPDDAGRAETEKAFYVSPFYPVDGFYRMSVPEPSDRLAITITLHRPEGRPFTATMRGVVGPAGVRGAVRTAIRNPLVTQRLRTQIFRHGIVLFLKGLPVVPRPPVDRPSNPEASMPGTPTAATRLESLVRDLAGIELPVRVRAWDGSEAGPADGPVLVIKSRRALRRLVWSPGELGLARAYVTGDIDVEGDLADGFRRAWTAARTGTAHRVRLNTRDRLRALGAATRLGAIGRAPKPPVSEARLSGRLHTRDRDRAAIAHHYDLSNEFYELLLDETMAYSSAYFTDADQPLADAQRAKLDLICRKLALEPGRSLLDVGCGWGSLILHAAEHYGVRATGVTLSAQQRDFVAKRIADRGLSDLVTVRLQDYREIPDGERYDAVSSIEMGEHVGEQQYPVYAATLYGHLREGGRLLLQQMSRHADTAPGGGAFIESYIAPDMHMRPLPSTIGFLVDAGFEIRDVEAMREHYVRTVDAWIETFEANYEKFVSLVGDEVARVWRLYLVGGGLSFAEGRMGVDQILAVRSSADGVSGLPARRPWTMT